MAHSTKHEVPRLHYIPDTGFFYALTTEIYAPLATCFKVCWVGFGLFSGVFFLTSTPVQNYLLSITVGFNRRLEGTTFTGTLVPQDLLG